MAHLFLWFVGDHNLLRVPPPRKPMLRTEHVPLRGISSSQNISAAAAIHTPPSASLKSSPGVLDRQTLKRA